MSTDPLQHALAGASRSAPGPRQGALPRVLVLGAGSPLGAAVLESLLANPRFGGVGTVVRAQGFAPALRGVVPLADEDTAWGTFAPQSALVVFDRVRSSNGRDDVFLAPQPGELVLLAQRLRAAGVLHLVVAVPHSPALLPQALMHGLATLDEGALASMGFAQLVFLRMARHAERASGLSAPQRLAAWVLRQMHWMVPRSEQPVRNSTLARVLSALLPLLAQAPPATRVLPPVVLWHAAQGADMDTLLSGWLRGETLPPAATRFERA